MNILVGLIEHFGDIVASEPVSRYLRIKYPDARTTWAVREPFRELIDTNPQIDTTLILDCLTDWIKLVKHSHYDLVVDLHVNYRSCSRCQVPLVKETGDPLVNAFEWFDHGALLEAFSVGAGLPRLSAHPRLYIQDQHRVAVDALNLPGAYCAIHREASSSEKSWSNAHWHSLVRYVNETLGLPVVEIGVRADGDSLAGCNVIDLRGRTTLLETAEVIRRARFFVGVDSGPAHCANAAKTPGVLLLGRIGLFRKYHPYTGFYASDTPLVRVVRNLNGPVAELPLADVIEATGYLARYLDEHDSTRAPQNRTVLSSALVPKQVNPEYREIARHSGFFDSAWYRTHYADELDLSADPFDYFLTVGARLGHSPGSEFDARWYKSQRPDLKALEDPLEHYLLIGKREGLTPVEVKLVRDHEAEEFRIAAKVEVLAAETPLRVDAEGQNETLPRIFAFYLPQFHPIGENNFAHRPGFTEWTNVINAKPLFRGHYQPRIPGELGYYDLRSVDVMREQVRLANEHGITGFCFYYYYFQGKRILYKPLQNYLDSDIQAPFLYLWANENWTRRWDGGDHEIILSQNHSPEDDRIFIRDLFPVFADDRYVKIDGRPVLAVYKTHLFSDIKASAEIWREAAVRYGFPDLYLVTVDDWHENPQRPREIGFDAYYELPSNIVPDQVTASDADSLQFLNRRFKGRLIDYRKFASLHMGRPFPSYTRFRTVMAPWDNTPRYASKAIIHLHGDGDDYQRWLSQALVETRRRYRYEEQIVFLHSWNEWCEGTYLEPDGVYGRRLLLQTRQAIESLRGTVALERTEAESKAGLFYRDLLRRKDEGAARYLEAMRQKHLKLHQRLRDRVTAQKAALEERSAKAGAAERALVEAEERARVAEERACAAEQRASAAEEKLRQVYNSKSWRLTKPLRSLMDTLPKPEP